MIYIGQAVKYQIRKGEFIPGVYLGTSHKQMGQATSYFYDIVCLDGNKLKKENATLDELDNVREPNKTSPSGKSIYYGAFCRRGVNGNFKIKCPAEDALMKEFRTIKTIIKND